MKMFLFCILLRIDPIVTDNDTEHLLNLMQLAGPHIIPNSEAFKIEINFFATHSTKIATFMLKTNISLNVAAGLMERLL